MRDAQESRGLGVWYKSQDLTRFVSGVIDAPYRIVLSLLSTGFLRGEGSTAVEITPPLSWVAVIVSFALLGLWAGGRGLALLVAACFLFIAVFGQWQSAMVTLASILVAVPLGAVSYTHLTLPTIYSV